MTDRFVTLQQYLEGLTRDMPKPFLHLAEIFEHQVFELCRIGEEEEKTYAVPYMMNDALEDYLILHNCRMVGEYVKHEEADTEAQIVKEDEGYVLVVRQGTENVFTLHFTEIEEKVNCYQYHEIGHYWVKGQEHWRQLVYIIGTIYDKYEYLGEQFCNHKELELLRLMEFAPFREWSPIHESLEEQYPATYEGVETMEKFVKEAEDNNFLRWLRFYRRFPSKYLEKVLCQKMLSPKRQAVYELIWAKVKTASEAYSKRMYDSKLDIKMQEEREQLNEELKKEVLKVLIRNTEKAADRSL